ncbi:DUF4179 domain-containing protein [Paenibacillus lignilyticus]|uniref:DUF4179 domain-containing protein n=1 Tax=Paenibacillus lignilyticus TaxID=1172615 RepID=A0ABS5CBQ8_9BACL|nr:DUF4179 domain-containing protein [Paenibacillus lignilyticus]MBP3962900.1 DUF4179 domain-containing protein [Paenibacillus lignilyticus]
MNEFRDSNEQDWPQLEAMKEQINQIVVPSTVEERIRNGMRVGRQRRRRRTVTRFASYTACLLLLIMVASVRFSPVVAAYVGDLPGLRSLVELINDDKGLELAIENDFMQPVGLSEEHDGIKVTVDGVLADESRVIVFYTLTNMDGRKRVVNLQKVDLATKEQMSISHGSSDFSEEWVSKQGTVDFNFHNGAEVPDILRLELKVGKDEKAVAGLPFWQFAIPIDKAKFEGLKETYAINKTVTVEGQRITFGTMTVYPTRIGLEVAYDPANTKKLFYFDDIRIEDEHGETFGTINNGVSGSTIDENRQILYFQSNYFRKPDRLYLRANSIRALDKNKLEIQVDPDQKKLLSSPDGHLTLIDVGTSKEDGQRILVFKLTNDNPLDEHRQYNILDMRFKDASGKSFESGMTGSSGDEFQYFIKKAKYQSPLTLTIVDYPTRIEGDIKLRMK